MKGGFEGYRERRNEIRTLPQDTKEEKTEKHERAKLFRMEVLFDNALCIETLISALEDNPNMSKEGLEQLLLKSRVVHPEVTTQFVRRLLDIRIRVEEVLDALAAKHSPERKAQLLYCSVARHQKKNEKPQGQLTMDTTYPLALALYVSNPEDFARIDARRNIGGFYAATQNVKLIGNLNPLVFPFIAIMGSQGESDYVMRHEKGHAENRVLQNALPKDTHRVVWGNLADKPTKEIVAYSTAVDTWSQSSDEEEQRKLLEYTRSHAKEQDKARVLQYALAHAKDEILAEYHANQESFGAYRKHLLKRGGLYDYFGNSLSIDTSSATYKELWTSYESILHENIDVADAIVRAYKRLGLFKRIDHFRWVLAQIPVEKWKEQLEATLFVEEATILGDVPIVPPTFLRMRVHDNGHYPSSIMYHTLRNDLLQNQHAPLIPIVHAYLEKMTAPDPDKDKKLASVVAKLSQKSAELFVLEKQHKLRSGGGYELEKFYYEVCGDVGLDPDDNFIVAFIEKEGWKAFLRKSREVE
jgi:hypothetical protein